MNFYFRGGGECSFSWQKGVVERNACEAITSWNKWAKVGLLATRLPRAHFRDSYTPSRLTTESQNKFARGHKAIDDSSELELSPEKN